MAFKHRALMESNLKIATLQEEKSRMHNSNIDVSASFDSERSSQELTKCQKNLNGHCPMRRECPNIHPDLCDSCKSAMANMEVSKIERLCTSCCWRLMDIHLDLYQHSRADSQRECKEPDDLKQIKEEKIVFEDFQDSNFQVLTLGGAQPENGTYLENGNISGFESLNLTVETTRRPVLVTEETDIAVEDLATGSHKHDDRIKGTEISSRLKEIQEYSSPLVKNIDDKDKIKIRCSYLEWKKIYKKKKKDCPFHRFFNFISLPYPLRKHFYNNYRNFVGSVTEDDNYYQNLVHSTKDDDKAKEIESKFNRYDWIIFVDYENYLSFFDDIKIETSTNHCLIWFCINAVTPSPSEIKAQHFTELKQHAEVLVSRAIGSSKNAADNVIFILIHQLDRLLSPNVKLAVISGDEDLHVLQDFKLLNGRLLKILYPKDFTDQLTQFFSKRGDINEDLNVEGSGASQKWHKILYENPKSEFQKRECVKILDATTMPLKELEFSELSESLIFYDTSVGSPEKQLQKANIFKHKNLFEFKSGLVPFVIMKLVLDLSYYHNFGKLAQILIYSGKKKNFASFEQQFYGGELTVEFKGL